LAAALQPTDLYSLSKLFNEDIHISFLDSGMFLPYREYFSGITWSQRLLKKNILVYLGGIDPAHRYHNIRNRLAINYSKPLLSELVLLSGGSAVDMDKGYLELVGVLMKCGLIEYLLPDVHIAIPRQYVPVGPSACDNRYTVITDVKQGEQIKRLLIIRVIHCQTLGGHTDLTTFPPVIGASYTEHPISSCWSVEHMEKTERDYEDTNRWYTCLPLTPLALPSSRIIDDSKMISYYMAIGMTVTTTVHRTGADVAAVNLSKASLYCDDMWKYNRPMLQSIHFSIYDTLSFITAVRSYCEVYDPDSQTEYFTNI